LYLSLKLNSKRYGINKKKYMDDNIVGILLKKAKRKENNKNILSIEKFTFIFKQPIKSKEDKAQNNTSSSFESINKTR
jgi:hypothetical protein